MKDKKEIRQVLAELEKDKYDLLYLAHEEVTINPGAETMDITSRLKTLNTHIGILKWVMEKPEKLNNTLIPPTTIVKGCE